MLLEHISWKYTLERTTGKEHRIKRWERSLAPHRYSVPGLGGDIDQTDIKIDKHVVPRPAGIERRKLCTRELQRRRSSNALFIAADY